MPDFRRRQVLLGALGIGSLAAGVSGALRRRRIVSQQTQLTSQFLNNSQAIENAVNDAIEGDLEASAEVEQIMAELRLTPPTVPYDRSISKQLIVASRLATEQYLTGKFNLRYGGAVVSLPSYGEPFSGYTQVASIQGPEMVTAEQQLPTNGQEQSDPLQAGVALIRSRIQGVASQALVVQWSYPVYWGFVLTSPRHHILVLRGTQRGHEWLQTINAMQVDTSDLPEFSFPGSIHRGFGTIYARLSKAILEAVQKLEPSKPLYLSGHSLGAPLASLAALDIAQQIPAFRETLRLYTYAAPRLGNPTFAEAFSSQVPNAYRIFNQADVVPKLPPTRAGKIVFVHAGEAWGFSSSLGDIGPNHFISAYRRAIESEQEQRLG